MNFRCPYCNQPTTITTPNKFSHWENIIIEQSVKGSVGFNIFVITCPNPECRNLFLKAQLTNVENNEKTRYSWGPTKILQEWQLLPESEAKVIPDFVPEAIRNDYYEACRIRDLSPKASATLSRRCLQGMIRDFWGIKKRTLKQEVDSLEKLVSSTTWEAIDAVREVGNIGAHMERDINLIIEIEPNEAQLLIELIEQLIEDWYVEKHASEQRLKKIKEMAMDKKEAKSSTAKTQEKPQ